MTGAVRATLAAAASTVEGIDVTPYFSGSTAAGSGMVRLDRIEYPNPFGGVCHWNLVVLLPQDMADAEQYLEEHVPAIRAAVEEHIVITQVQPQRLDLPNVGILPCVFINGHREEE